jgi:hypothetical protein
MVGPLASLIIAGMKSKDEISKDEIGEDVILQ